MHLYIHIPFCDSKCGYCAFFSKTNQNHLLAPYFESLLLDLKHQIQQFCVHKISSIFIGGGTPNIADSKYYAPIFEILLPLCQKDCEITLEANPNLLKKDWLLDLKSFGLNRLSMGVQSFYEDKLKLLERNHNQKDIFNAFDIALNSLENVNIDLIYDCVLDSKERLYNELQSALQLGITHLSAYSLSIDSHSSFAKHNRNDTQSKQSYGEFVRDFLTSFGFLQYEVSNYSPHKKCQHNLGYWQNHEYLGVGASAVGRIGNHRYNGFMNIESYIKTPLQKNIEVLSQKDLEFEEIFLGLRSEVGVRREILDSKKLDIVLDEKLCFESKNRIYAKDFFNADNLALYLS